MNTFTLMDLTYCGVIKHFETLEGVLDYLKNQIKDDWDNEQSLNDWLGNITGIYLNLYKLCEYYNYDLILNEKSLFFE